MREAGRKLRVLCGAGQESPADFISECDGAGLSRKGDTGCNIMKPSGRGFRNPIHLPAPRGGHNLPGGRPSRDIPNNTQSAGSEVGIRLGITYIFHQELGRHEPWDTHGEVQVQVVERSAEGKEWARYDLLA